MSSPQGIVELSGHSASKYRILLELGEGGMANVFLAVSLGPAGFSKLVVLKIPKLRAGDPPAARRLFSKEAQLSARLNHENVVAVHEVIEDDERLILVMEYLEGQSFSALMRASGAMLPLAVGLGIIIEALAGLHYAHDLEDYDGRSLNLVHRDVSPHNLFVSYSGGVKVLDFGIAKIDEGETTESDHAVVKGKLRYMAPEQLEGAIVDRRADIFAMGVVLWEVLTGTRLWEGTQDAQVIHQLLTKDIPSPTELNPACAPELALICSKALARDPAGRYSSAAEFQADLARFCEQQNLNVGRPVLGSFVVHTFSELREARKRTVERRLSELQNGPALAREDATERVPMGAAKPRTESGPPTAPFAPSERPRRRWGLPLAGILLVSLVFLTWRRGEQKAPATPTNTGPSATSSASSAPMSARIPVIPSSAGPTPHPETAPSAKHSAPSVNPPNPRRTTNAAINCVPPYVLDQRGIRHPKPECI